MIHIIKKTGIYLLTLLFTVVSWSCTEDEINENSSIFKDSDPALQTDFDKWLLTNFTYPYNIVFKYKMKDIEAGTTYELVPATVEKSIAFAKLIKHLWIEVYDDVAGSDFTRTYIPRVIHLIGSGAYNTNNTVLLGTAEGGMKITLYRINDLDPQTVTIDFLTDRYLKTMFHESAHILHQTKNYSEEFAKITNSDYVSDDWNSSSNTLEAAYQRGFVSRYARKEANEDFVEILSIFVVRGQNNWASILQQAGEDGADKINQKFEIVQNYLKTSWNIDIYELRRIFESRAKTMHLLDLTHF
ncbi:MAG: putative zinc-binding metallopeptidase [Prevotellaceae bacterium]|nr:putative zinc-binding metallopeptidase [Prevotellaceae bacterium]